MPGAGNIQQCLSWKPGFIVTYVDCGATDSTNGDGLRDNYFNLQCLQQATPDGVLACAFYHGDPAGKSCVTYTDGGVAQDIGCDATTVIPNMVSTLQVAECILC